MEADFYGMNSAHPFENPTDLTNFPVLRGDDAISLFTGADVRADAETNATCGGNIFRDDGAHDRHRGLGCLLRHAEA